MARTLRGTTMGSTWQELKVFESIPAPVLAGLEEAATRMEFPQGHEIMRQGEPGTDMYILLEGEIRIVSESTLRDTRFERVLAAPAVFGEMALLTSHVRTATVRAETPIRCLRLTKADLDALVSSVPGVMGVMTAIVGKRLLEAETISHVGKYRVTGRLGSGAMATVFEAMQPDLERPVALKMLSHQLVSQPGFLETFKSEGRIVAQLDHENIVRVHDTVEAYGTHFIVMEKLTGAALDELIRHRVRPSWGVVRRILREICLALEYSHGRGLLHRDIKPSNVYLTADRRVKLLDFGIAVALEASDGEGKGLVGTPWYMSPEHIAGRRLDGRSDQYSLGILAYELITHEMPFRAAEIQDLWRHHLKTPVPDPRERVPDCPEDLAELVRRATQKRRADRFRSCKEAHDFLVAAGEVPLVDRFSLCTIAVSFHPSRADVVKGAVAKLEERLERLDGVACHCSFSNAGDDDGEEG